MNLMNVMNIIIYDGEWEVFNIVEVFVIVVLILFVVVIVISNGVFLWIFYKDFLKCL